MEIKILNLTFKIVEKETIEYGSTLIGQINHIEQKIYIKKGLTSERKKKVLIHETLHSIFEQLGFIDEHENEHLINSLATALYQVLEDNKALIS